MMAGLLVAGIGVLLVGLLAIGFGIPVKEFSFGNTLILVGAVAACTGMVLVGLWTVVRELKNIAQRLGPGMSAASRAGTGPRPAAAGATPRDAQENEDFLFGRGEPALENPGHGEPSAASSGPSPAPWQEEAATRDRTRADAPEPVEAAPAVKPRRNLLFSSSSRKERERAEARATDPSAIAAIDVRPPVAEADQMSPPATFDDAWPQSERAKTAAVPPQVRGSRAPSTFTDANAGGAPAADRHPPVARQEDQPPVTVLKSGVVDGMAYSLYSDGSIEAQMPEGMMRFASIDELRSHLDQRP
jgi:hypothetical protein